MRELPSQLSRYDTYSREQLIDYAIRMDEEHKGLLLKNEELKEYIVDYILTSNEVKV